MKVHPLIAGTATAAAAVLAASSLTGCVSGNPFESARPDVAPIAQTPDTTPDYDTTPGTRFGNTPAASFTEVPTVSGDADIGFVSTDAREPNAFGEFEGEGERPYKPVAGRAGYQQHTYVDEGFDTDVAVSPDGEAIAFASTRHSQRSDIYLQSTSGLAVTKLTTDPADDAFPSFSPQGDRIAFCSNRAGNWDVYVMDRDGRNVTAITQGTGHDLHPSFSPDGRKLVFCRIGSRSDQWELWTADIATGEKTMIGFGLFPDWSPRMDKDVIAFQRARQRGGRWFSLWTLELDNGEPTNVTEVAMSTNAALVAPAWSPDGMKIAFATVVEPGAGMPDTDSAVGRQDIWTIDADGTNRHRITDGKGTYATPSWAENGRVFFVSDRGGTECVWSARADATNLSRMATRPPTPAQPKASTTPPFANTGNSTID
ncbi:MAG: DPP IV N-terminal domain-containing protein [Planctomycetota bacterium]